jgi:hypothetical protein
MPPLCEKPGAGRWQISGSIHELSLYARARGLQPQRSVATSCSNHPGGRHQPRRPPHHDERGGASAPSPPLPTRPAGSSAGPACLTKHVTERLTDARTASGLSPGDARRITRRAPPTAPPGPARRSWSPCCGSAWSGSAPALDGRIFRSVYGARIQPSTYSHV